MPESKPYLSLDVSNITNYAQQSIDVNTSIFLCLYKAFQLESYVYSIILHECSHEWITHCPF